MYSCICNTVCVLLDPVQVIGLYPHLLPSDLRQSLSRPSTPATLTGEDLKKGTECLINYLTQVGMSIVGVVIIGFSLVSIFSKPCLMDKKAFCTQFYIKTKSRHVHISTCTYVLHMVHVYNCTLDAQYSYTYVCIF